MNNFLLNNPLVDFYRQMVLRRSRSTVPTTLLPLSKIHSATVFVEAAAGEEDPACVCQAVRQFFDNQGIPVLILCPQRRDINWLGQMKRRARGTPETRQEDLFISLAGSPDNFAATYEACCSTARFKVGRFPLPDEVFDLVVSVPEADEAQQTASFDAIKDYLCKIK